MGVDMVISVSGDLTPEQKQRIEWRIGSAGLPTEWHSWRQQTDDEGMHLGWEYYNTYRYYGIGYARGPWPEIYGLIRLFKAEFPDREISYGGDNGDVVPATDEYLASIWDHWAKCDRQPYVSGFSLSDAKAECCGHPMVQFGWGGGKTRLSCPRCSNVVEV